MWEGGGRVWLRGWGKFLFDGGCLEGRRIIIKTENPLTIVFTKLAATPCFDFSTESDTTSVAAGKLISIPKGVTSVVTNICAQ